MITNLRMDPYERGLEEGGGAIDFIARQMWLLVPVQGAVKAFFQGFEDYPYQTGSSLNAAGINYGFLKQEDALKRLHELEMQHPGS
jgi:arylsulfatase